MVFSGCGKFLVKAGANGLACKLSGRIAFPNARIGEVRISPVPTTPSVKYRAVRPN
jgi:hypothetical protein